MSPRQMRLTVFPLLMLTIFLAGCPKRPATSPVAAPAPTGAPGPAAPSPGRVETQPSGPVTGGPGTRMTPPMPQEFKAIEALKDIHFDFDKYDIRPADAKILDENAKWMKVNPNYLILVEGHCDERGTNEYNMALGERRAKAAMNYLVAQGVTAARITTISYGEERPLCTEHNETCWTKNRRAHFLVKPQ